MCSRSGTAITYPLSSCRSVEDTGGRKMRNRAITLREEITAPDSGASIRKVGPSDDSTRLSVVALKTARTEHLLTGDIVPLRDSASMVNSPERVDRQEHMPVSVCYWTDQAELLRSSREGGGCGHQYQQAPSPSRARICPPTRSWGIHALHGNRSWTGSSVPVILRPPAEFPRSAKPAVRFRAVWREASSPARGFRVLSEG